MAVNRKEGRVKPPKTTTSTPMSFEEYVLSLKSNADDAYKQTVANAEIERQRAAVDAQNAYHHAMPTYGTTAESLSASGLTGSGYSDYLQSKAYGQMRTDMNAANRTKQLAVNDAATVKNTAYAKADATYMGYLEQKETAQKNAYMSLYDSVIANPSAYSLDDITRLGGTLGLTAEQISELTNVRNEKFLAGGTYTVQDLRDMFGENDPRYTEYYDKLVNESNSINFTDEDEESGLMDKNKAQGIIDNMTAAGIDTTNIQNKFDNVYSVNKGTGIKFNKDGGTDKPGEKGNNISVTDSNGKKYRVEYTGNTVSEAVQKVGANVDDNTVFKYDGSLYVKVNGVIYSIGARPLWQDSYKELLSQFDDKTNK